MRISKEEQSDMLSRMIRKVDNYIKRRQRSTVTERTSMINGILVAVLEEIVRMNKPKTLKVLRTGDAKQFPLLHAKKDGDVGYDLPAVLPYKPEFESIAARVAYIDKLECEGVPRDEIERNMRQSLWLNRANHWEADCEDEVPGRATVPTGIKLEIPFGYWASIEARSSTSNQLITVPKGVIDEGYRGELFAVLLNFGPKPIEIRHGDRLVQLIIHKRQNADIIVEEVDELSESDRGSDGFGSTGQRG